MHGLSIAEVAPAAPVAGELLALAGLIVALGLIKFSDKFCRALFGRAEGWVSHIPWIGSTVADGLKSVEARLTNYLADAEQSVDAAIGATWHATARTIDYLEREIRRHAGALLIIASTIPGAGALAQLYGLVKKIPALAKVVTHTSTTVIQHVTKVEKIVTHTITRTVPAVARSVAIPINDVLTGDVADLRKRVRAIEDGAVDLYRKAKGVITVPAVAAAAAVVAVALTALNLNWIRCRNWNKVGRQVCRMPANDLEGLLGLLVAGIAVADLRDTVKALQKIEHTAAEGIETLLKV